MNRFALIFIFIAIKAEAQTSALAVADSLHAVGKYAEAIERLKEIGDKDEAVYLKLASAHEAMGDLEAALENYQTVLGKNPGRTLTAFTYGKLLTRMGKLEPADSIIRVLLKKYPDNSAFAYQLGLIGEKKKDSSAIIFFRMAASLDESNELAHYKVARSYLQSRNFIQAKHMALRGLSAHSNNPPLLSVLAQTHYHLEEYEDAVAAFQKLVKLGEGSEFVHRHLGASFTHLGKFKEAIDQYNRALEYDEENPANHHNLGRLYLTTGEFKSAEGHLLTAILLKRQPIDAEYFDLALVYRASEDQKRAFTYLEKALEENPAHEEAAFQRAIVGDSLYKDLEMKKSLYQAYLDKFEKTGNERFVLLAKRRVEDINEEIHLSK